MKASIEKLIDQYENYNLSEVIDYDKFNNFAIVHHSSTIEGSTLSKVETRLLLDENLTPKGKPLEHSLMVKDHYAALQFIFQEASSNRTITPEFIKEINAHVLKSTEVVYNTIFGAIDASQETFRKVNVSAGGTYFVNYDKVEGLVKDLTDELNFKMTESLSKMENLELSFVAHFQLVTIHPFDDGNGRTSRLLMNYIQKIKGLPLSIVHKEDRAEYFDALEKTRKLDDINVFNDFMYGQYEKYLNEEIKKYEVIYSDKDNKGKNQ